MKLCEYLELGNNKKDSRTRRENNDIHARTSDILELRDHRHVSCKFGGLQLECLLTLPKFLLFAWKHDYEFIELHFLVLGVVSSIPRQAGRRHLIPQKVIERVNYGEMKSET